MQILSEHDQDQPPTASIEVYTLPSGEPTALKRLIDLMRDRIPLDDAMEIIQTGKEEDPTA